MDPVTERFSARIRPDSRRRRLLLPRTQDCAKLQTGICIALSEGDVTMTETKIYVGLNDSETMKQEFATAR